MDSPSEPSHLPLPEAAATILALAAARPATLGRGRLICLDGRAGSGKTTLAAAVAGRAAGTRTVHLDDLYDGWDGLDGVETQLDSLLRPLASGQPGHYRRYDWHAGRFAELVRVDPVELLVLEGVGAGHRDHAALCTLLVWLTASEPVRKRRALRRDGEIFEPHWSSWAGQEATYVTTQRPDARSDLVVELAVTD